MNKGLNLVLRAGFHLAFILITMLLVTFLLNSNYLLENEKGKGVKESIRRSIKPIKSVSEFTGARIINLLSAYPTEGNKNVIEWIGRIHNSIEGYRKKNETGINDNLSFKEEVIDSLRQGIRKTSGTIPEDFDQCFRNEIIPDKYFDDQILISAKLFLIKKNLIDRIAYYASGDIEVNRPYLFLEPNIENPRQNDKCSVDALIGIPKFLTDDLKAWVNEVEVNKGKGALLKIQRSGLHPVKVRLEFANPNTGELTGRLDTFYIRVYPE